MGGGSPDRVMAATARLMDAAVYDAWYNSPRGRWIGDAEFRLLADRRRVAPGETLLDVGCGSACRSARS